MLPNSAGLFSNVVLDNQERTTTGNSTGVDVSDYEGLAEVMLVIPGVQGTTPSDTVVLETSSASGSGYATAKDVNGNDVSFTAVTADGALQRFIIDLNAQKRYLRAAHTISGTNPVINVAVILRALKKSMP